MPFSSLSRILTVKVEVSGNAGFFQLSMIGIPFGEVEDIGVFQEFQ